jgi:site-specific DNA-adenine methylase
MLSNHNTQRIQMLYEDYTQKVVSAKRSINSDGAKR